MNIAEKLLTVSSNNKTMEENAPKVYEAGQMSIIKTKAYGSGTLTGCLDEPIFYLSFSFPSGAAKIVFTSESGETQEIIYSHSTGALPGGVIFNDGKVIAEDSLGNVIDITNTSVGEQIKALRTYAGTTYVTSDFGVSVGYYKDVRQAKYEEGEKVGKKSEKDKIDFHFKRSKEAVNMRGGEIDMNADIDVLPEAIANIPIDASLGFNEDSEIAYQKIVPNGAEDYALLKELGGMTYKCSNLIPFQYPDVPENLTEHIIINNNRSITVKDLTAPEKADISWFFFKKFLPAGDYTYNKGGAELSSVVSLRENGDSKRNNIAAAGTFSVTEEEAAAGYEVWINIYVKQGTSANGTILPMLNAGTAALPYEPYYEGLRDAKVTKIVSKGNNREPITYSIPEAILNLDGYGLGIDATNYNYCDFVNKKFIQKVGYDENGELIAFEKIETDLPKGFDNFLSVEGGGSLEFVNEHKKAVPSTVKYIRKVGS